MKNIQYYQATIYHILKSQSQSFFIRKKMECWEEPSGHCPIQSRQTLPWNFVLHNPPFSFADNCCILRCVYSSAAHGIMCARHCSQSDWYDAQSPTVSIDYCSCEVRFNTRYVIHSECNSYFFLGIHVHLVLNYFVLQGTSEPDDPWSFVGNAWVYKESQKQDAFVIILGFLNSFKQD